MSGPGVPEPRRSARLPAERRAARIRVAARIGVWGFLAALVPPIAEALGRPLDPGLIGPVSGIGLVASGLGTAVAALLVWRSILSRLTPLKLAALLGVPLGATLTLGGIALLRPLSTLADVVDAARWAALALAVAVVGLLLWGFASSRPPE